MNKEKNICVLAKFFDLLLLHLFNLSLVVSLTECMYIMCHCFYSHLYTHNHYRFLFLSLSLYLYPVCLDSISIIVCSDVRWLMKYRWIVDPSYPIYCMHSPRNTSKQSTHTTGWNEINDQKGTIRLEQYTLTERGSSLSTYKYFRYSQMIRQTN